MIVLSVESSCDETSVSINRDGINILSNVVLSQIDVHKQYGGVVPEIASREHIKGITIVFEEAIENAGIKKEEINLVAVTKGPGLIGSLLIGVNAAKAFAYANDIPIIGVHHIAGHIYANAISEPLQFPLVCLVVSGGHTELILMKEHYDFLKLGETMDDAVGEAYDKVARTVGLGYPGGPVVDRLAKEGTASYKMPNIDQKDSYNFSFSGLKSHVINLVHNLKQRKEEINIPDLCASFQETVTEVLVNKSIKAIDEFGKNPTLMQHFKRSVQNWSAYASAPFVFLLYVNIILFSVISGVLGFIVGALVFAAYVMLLIREDGRGLHDLWADTRVVKVDYDIDKEFVEKTALMGEWANVTADESLEEDEWNKKIDDENEEKDPWDE